jgi:hypothetical protein
MRKIYVVLVLLLFICINGFGQTAGFNNSFIVLNVNGSANTYYDLQASTANPDFTAGLGTFVIGTNTLLYQGAEHNIYKCGGCDFQSSRLYYRIYKASVIPGALPFVSDNIPYSSGFVNGCGGEDQQWKTTSGSVNLLAGLTPDIYTMEVYSEGTVTCLGGTVYASNSGNNYKANFTVACNPATLPSVTIADVPASPICAGTNVTFTATPANGGAAPSYQWYVGVSPVGTNSATFASNTLVNGDAVSVVMTSNDPLVCAGSLTVTSNTITKTVNPNLPASVTIAAAPAGPICGGTSVTFTPTPANGGATPTYQWQVNGNNVATGATYTSSTLVNSDVVRVIMTSNATPCLTGSPATSTGITTVINSGSIWSGTTNTNWNIATNWLCGNIPTSNDNVTIPTGLTNYPIITTGSAIANNISIAAGASVTVNAAGVFNLYGAITNAGTFDVTAGTLNLAGTTAQTLAGTSLLNGLIKNLTLSNAAGISLSAPLGVTSNVAFGASNVTFATNNNLTLVSNLAGTANLNDITNNGTVSGNTITGNVNIERYLPARKAWRFLATPIVIGTSPTITNSWREGTAGTAGPLTSTSYGTRITGPNFPSTLFDQYTVRASMKWFDMNFGTGDFRDVTNTADPIANNEGYFVFVRGDRAVDIPDPATITTLRIKGEVRTGTQPAYVVSNFKTLSIGNPYPSRIDFRSIAKTNIADQFTVWTPFSPGSYNAGKYEQYVNDGTGEYRLNGLPAGAIRDYIESGEAFLIQNNDPGGATGNIVIAEKDKSASGSANVSRAGVTNPTLEFNLFTNDATGTEFLADAAVLNFDNSFENTMDNKDVRKVFNVADNISIKSNNNLLVVERRKKPLATDSIFLTISGMRIANYTLNIDPSVLNNLGVNAFIKDNFLGIEMPVSLTNVTNIPFSITTDAASKAADRFMIVFRAATGPLPVRFIDIAATKNADKTNTVKWNVGNEFNIQQYQIERSDKGSNFVSIGSTQALNNAGGNKAYDFIDAAPLSSNNYYRIKSIGINGEIQYSAIVKLSAEEKMPSISVYPNPVTDRLVQVKFVNKSGMYNMRLIGADGKTMQTQKVSITSNNEMKSMDINKQVPVGTYDLIISADNETAHIKVVIVQ